MIGAIIGDIVGSIYEFDNHKSKEFELLPPSCFFTDDTVMTLAICKAILDCNDDYSLLQEKTISCMKELGNLYPNCSYGSSFREWLKSSSPKPYNSFGNGAAMRVSPIAYIAKDIRDVKRLSNVVTKVTHNHKEGLKGASATSIAIYLARTGKNKEEIKRYIDKHYYKIDFTLDSIRDTYYFDETCQNTVPQALQAFFESTSFEDAIRNAISIGGDSDTLAAITGSIAEAYYGVELDIREKALSFLDDRLKDILFKFEEKYERMKEPELKGFDR